jgi:hypothetical protein
MARSKRLDRGNQRRTIHENGCHLAYVFNSVRTCSRKFLNTCSHALLFIFQRALEIRGNFKAGVPNEQINL